MLWLIWSIYGGGAMWIDVALSVLLYAIWCHGLVGTSWSIMIIWIVDLCEVWSYLSICEGMWKYVFFLHMLGNHVDYDYVLICVVLYVDTWLFLLDYMSCDGYIDDDIVCIGWHKDDRGHS